MSLHRIVGSEAGRDKPLVYVTLFRGGRRRIGGYVIAAVTGGLAVFVAAAAVAMIALR